MFASVHVQSHPYFSCGCLLWCFLSSHRKEILLTNCCPCQVKPSHRKFVCAGTLIASLVEGSILYERCPPLPTLTLRNQIKIICCMTEPVIKCCVVMAAPPLRSALPPHSRKTGASSNILIPHRLHCFPAPCTRSVDPTPAQFPTPSHPNYLW